MSSSADVNAYIKRLMGDDYTPAVARSSYIDPRVITAYETGDSLSKVHATIATMRPRKYLKPGERCLLKLLS